MRTVAVNSCTPLSAVARTVTSRGRGPDCPLAVSPVIEYTSSPVSPRLWADCPGANCSGSTHLPIRLERWIRSSLIGMCVLPLQFAPGQSAHSLGLTGEEVYSITGLTANGQSGPLPREVTVRATADNGVQEFTATVRIDTPAEAAYYRHGGILQYVLRQLLAQAPDPGNNPGHPEARRPSSGLPSKGEHIPHGE